ncbi:zinc finger protein 557 isoform X1 [Tribolium castaneum]|uniref:Zinc finger protein 226-like Protein n=2 Tax=Tribolium castaneum TaxID=7070 RepID=D6W8M5_TRICA|nr:PREDICTED: zinc finger protein 557 [Tribolium castaneum]EEZ98380.1 Zinc finger protein 226-like Protein [Tribolium castaneum]|eukprot:XP_008201370.1 PREDICTED: zinc finger protein 557 [Tribolium castaneum]
MRHLEQEVSSSDQCKAEYLDNFLEIKEEIPNLILDECENFMKNEFTSDEESGSNLHLDLNNDSESDEDDTAVKKRRNRRKSLVPQKAVQLEVSQNGSMFSGSESSQDLIEKTQSLCSSDTNIDKFLLSDNLNALEMPDNDDLLNINEEDIFKDLQEEADGEKLDDEILDNVKEEWRAHWGVKCNMCEQVFPYKTEFDKHYQDNYGLIPVYTCTFCNKTAEKYSTFRSHCYRHITEGRYKCQACPKGFSLQSMLHVHVLAKHTKAKPFKCDECGKSFVTKPGLKIHLRKHKTELKEDYPCVECGKILHTRGGLTSHMNVHRLGRRFMCDVCGKTFTQKVNMQQHVKQHTGDKPHGCDKCGKTFAEKSHLARHYSFHSDQRPFKCDVCQKMYKTERCLKVHSLVHAAARPFVCSYCSKGFLSSTKLKQHFNIHTGERPYKCKYCERTFTNYPNWLKHTRRRHKVDHKTGENLGPKVPKEETSQSTVIETTDTSEQLVADISLSKTEELLLQQGLLNFPLTDDKFVIPQQIDFLAGTSNNSVGVIVPYFQTSLPNHQTLIQGSNNVMTMQFSDLVHSQYLQQPLM